MIIFVTAGISRHSMWLTFLGRNIARIVAALLKLLKPGDAPMALWETPSEDLPGPHQTREYPPSFDQRPLHPP